MPTYYYRPQKLQLANVTESQLCDSYQNFIKNNPIGTVDEERNKYDSFIEKYCLKLPTGLTIMSTLPLACATTSHTLIASTGASMIREGFKEILEVLTAISEPVLWFYAVTGCVLMATDKNRDKGWSRLKNVGYSYIIISILPTIFSFLRWVATILSGAISLG